jgi:hypothetical protein
MNTSAEAATENLSQRLTDLEDSLSSQITELRTELSLAAAAMRSAASSQPNMVSPLGDLEDQLARAVTVSLSAALENIRESLTDAIAKAVSVLAVSLEQKIGATVSATAGGSGDVVRTQLSPQDVDDITASLQHSVLLALSSLEQSVTVPSTVSNEAVATVNDVARVNQRIDELRSLLLG